MKSYKITKIYLENFKLIDKALIDIENEDLIVLDGPNGFGKTTIFDAIELMLTGGISRIKHYNRQLGFDTLLFSKDNNKNTIVKIEFSSNNNEEVYTFVKLYKPQKGLKKRDRRPDNWDLFNTYKISDFNDDLSTAEKIDRTDVYELLGINEDLERLYNLYYYIQQEDNTQFLKQTGKKRMEAINYLFDTKIQQEEQKKISEVRNSLMTENRIVDEEIKKSKEKILTYKTVTKKEEKDSIHYISLFKDKKIEWDKKGLKIRSESQKNKYIAELLAIEDFIDNFSEFNKSLFNKGLIQVASNNSLLKSVIIGSNFIDEYEQIEKKFKREKKLQEVEEILIKENLLDNIKKINFNLIHKELNMEFKVESMDRIQESIILKQNSSSELSKIVKELNDTRAQLLKHLDQFHNKIDDESGECPFCGYDWKNYDDLLTKIGTKRKLFLEYYDNSTKIIEEKVNELYDEYLDPILSNIKKELETDPLVDKKFFDQLKSIISNKGRVKDFHKWCEKNSVDYLSYVNKSNNQQIKDIDNRIESLSNHLLKQKKEVKSGYTEEDSKFKEFENLYKVIFNSSKELIKTISKEEIQQKIKYIDYIFYSYNSTMTDEENKKLTKLKKISEELTSQIDTLREIIDLYGRKIKTHWNKIMTDIEIPFYIYSGKIIQEYQMGLGVFIEENPDGEAKNIKFVSDNRYDHDAIHYLSSGQLSAVIISFTLALNKVYGNQSLDIILIDDPLQTMDEINMASFTELLRNEFSHKQIIISTHEEDASRYLRYKFKKYRLNAMKLNVKDDLLLS